jgi:hypothetical protein
MGVWWACPSVLHAQSDAESDAENTAAAVLTPLKGQRVAIYVSRKGIQYSPDLYQPLAGWVYQDDTLGLSEDGLKQGVAVALGEYLRARFNTALGTDSSWFVNGNATAAQALLGRYVPGSPNIGPQTAALGAQTRYLLTVDALALRTIRRKSVYAVSNRIISEHRQVPQGELSLRVYDAQTGRLLADAQVTIDTENMPFTLPYLPTHDHQHFVQRTLNQLLNLALAQVFPKL